MTAARLTYGIPDVELERVCGGTLNPGCFAGHVLVVDFLPFDPVAEGDELEACIARADELARHDAWLIAVRQRRGMTRSDEQEPLPLVYDEDEAAWTIFLEAAQPDRELNRQAGAVFLFGRGGAFQKLWPGSGRMADVIRELEETGYRSKSADSVPGSA